MVEPVEVDVEEVSEEVEVGKVPPTGESVPEQAPALLETLLVAARIWAGGPGNQVAG